MAEGFGILDDIHFTTQEFKKGVEKMRQFVCAFALFAAVSAFAAAPTLHVTKEGASRVVVSIATAGGVSEKAYNRSLQKNLELTGYFQVGPNGQIRVTGAPGGAVTATGAGKQVTSSAAVTDDKSARMAARQLADAILQTYAGKRGFAMDRIAFVNRKGPDNAELYTCYPDGYDIRQMTSDKRAAVGPRWAPNKKDIYYTGFLQRTPLVYRLDTSTERRSLLAQFKGLATGAAVSPDGRTCAIVLSYQGNPELYVLDFATKRVSRMTRTPRASEASPCWSPDGRQIAYVSDETRHPQIYIVDVATRKSRRLTNMGGENTNPDWGVDGALTWCTKRGGLNYVAVMDPSKGESTARLVTDGGSWEHPSWAADGRHVVASRDQALFIVDTDPDGDRPARLFHNAGNWMNPAWCR